MPTNSAPVCSVAIADAETIGVNHDGGLDYFAKALAPWRAQFEQWAIDEYRAIADPLKARAAQPVNIANSLLECVQSGRPFCFMRNIDEVDLLRIRRACDIVGKQFAHAQDRRTP